MQRCRPHSRCQHTHRPGSAAGWSVPLSVPRSHPRGTARGVRLQLQTILHAAGRAAAVRRVLPVRRVRRRARIPALPVRPQRKLQRLEGHRDRVQQPSREVLVEVGLHCRRRHGRRKNPKPPRSLEVGSEGLEQNYGRNDDGSCRGEDGALHPDGRGRQVRAPHLEEGGSAAGHRIRGGRGCASWRCVGVWSALNCEGEEERAQRRGRDNALKHTNAAHFRIHVCISVYVH
mmetsp:Transcript_14538/g.41213  ORF Transcript_14538/g.41213 Transcript_14538/m.41213 type:complete len:231 (+) Transcript_14538:315-1007(+)